MTEGTSLSFHSLYSLLQIVSLVIRHLHAWNKRRSVCEQVVHLLERALGRLWENSPEEDRVAEVADAEKDVPFL